MVEKTEQSMLRLLTGILQDRAAWPQHAANVALLLTHPSEKVTAKALWTLGEIGLQCPQEIAPYAKAVAAYLTSANALLRERALNALGRIGRGDPALVEPYLPQMRLLAADSEPPVRLAFIWACENIATNTPELFANDMPLFAAMLTDTVDRVRIEAPEIFRVLGKRKPEYVTPYLKTLQALSQNDPEPVVRIHAAGAIRATEKNRSAK